MTQDQLEDQSHAIHPMAPNNSPDYLDDFQQIINTFFLPLLEETNTRNSVVVTKKKDTDSKLEQDDIQNDVRLFIGYIAALRDESTQSVRLKVPDVKDVHSARHCTQTLRALESAVEDWNNIIDEQMQKDEEMHPKSLPTPLAELEFWVQKSALFSSLKEQVHSKQIVEILEVVETISLEKKANVLSLRSRITELSKIALEAKENVKFLSTLERHFKNLATGSLVSMRETLLPMMNALRMVWILSRHYNDDQRMGSLFKKIAEEIANRVESTIDVSKIFKADIEQIRSKLRDGKDLLDSWYLVYMQVRESIEASRRDARWEFSRTHLFERTSYLSEVCNDLAEMVEIANDFFKFLGPELKAVTGDTIGIDRSLENVQAMCEAIESVPFNIFDISQSESWIGLKGQFHRDNESIMRSTRELIDSSFRKLRSAEAALELLRSFESIESRGALQQQVMGKTQDILTQFSREIDVARSIFDVQRVDPPIARNQPPIAGSIKWSRCLFARTKQTMDKLTAFHQDIQADSIGMEVQDKYMSFARMVLLYEKKKLKNWQTTSDGICLESLKLPILKKEQERGAVEVNFPSKMNTLIKEASCLDKMGFELSEITLNVALQSHKFKEYVESLNTMLSNYQKAVHQLNEVESGLLKTHLTSLEQSLSPGLSALNWYSLGIGEFIKACNNAINRFNSLVSQVKKSSSAIEEVLGEVIKTPLFIASESHNEIKELSQFMDDFETHIDETIEKLLKRTNTIPQFLTKIEECVFGTNTGKCADMREFYVYYEKLLYQSLNFMVLNGMKIFESTLQKCSRSRSAPLFKVLITLSSPEILVTPSVNDINKSLGRVTRKFVECTKQFIRWMDGTCLEAPPIIRREDEDPFIFSFYLDISANQQIIRTMLGLNHYIQKSISIINRNVESWRRHQSLWKTERTGVIEKFKLKNPTTAEFLERLAKYHKMECNLIAQGKPQSAEFLTIDSHGIAFAASKASREWIKATVDAMKELDDPKLQRLSNQIESHQENLRKVPDTLENLRSVLHTISQIRKQSMNFEVEMEDLDERYRTRILYSEESNLEASKADYKEVKEVQEAWRLLNEEADIVEVNIVDSKKHFSHLTQEQAEEFVKKTEVLWEEYQKEGPGVSDKSLAEGIVALKTFSGKLATFTETRDELLLSQRLFDVETSDFKFLNKVVNEMKKLDAIYAVYQEHSTQIRMYSQIRWTDIDIAKMNESVLENLSKLRSLKELKRLPTFDAVEKEILSFIDSLPLMKDLKSDALRHRHWEQLMKVTGQEFELDLNSFTLGSLISMKLHNFAAEVQKVTTAAIKEQTIEEEIAKLEHLWSKQKLTIQKYTKGTKERGFVLKATDEVLLLLEDMTMNVQSMLASPYVRPLLDEVRSWEQKLSLIGTHSTTPHTQSVSHSNENRFNSLGECIEIWMTVQRKWMYLESIFIGSDDIRQQLPKEAKKFDAIDAQWLRIMTETNRNPIVLEACSINGRLQTLIRLSEQLEDCQKSLSEYLDTKRCAFPRFYFISDDELLSILGSSDPTSVQEHMLKLFDNCASLKFGRQNEVVMGMISSEGECFDFSTPVAIEGPVEQWMKHIETEMKLTLHQRSKEGVFHYVTLLRTKWLEQYLGMVTLLGSQIWWTFETEDAFAQVQAGNKHGVKNLSKKLTNQLADLTALVRSELSTEFRKKINTLMILDVHSRDIIESFIRDSVLDAGDFSWESQLRFYWKHQLDDVEICQCSGRFDYGYEYMGLNGRLVITALTDRCYMTLTTALTFNLGGAPAGPAGTGKTETTKDLAKSLALLCVVFNCGEGLDYKAMGSIFSGLVQAGAWGCFDEFNRIEAEVLSVVSSQIKQIQEALKLKMTQFSFEGKDLALNPRTGIFITMNPGYAGRTELPDNLKALFRPVTMVVPDMEQICEIMLFSEGFDGAKMLAKKMTVLYKLAREQLSKQYHYDFGLRALKSVLTMAGTLKRESKNMGEDLVLMRALRDMNLPKFVYDDVSLFLGLINDLFPGLDCPRVRYEELNDVVEKELDKQGYQVLSGPSEQVDKIIQLYEVMQTRHTTMVVGQTGGGKTVILNTLTNALTQLGTKTTLFTINPKAQTIAELYGLLDPDTRDWTDGLLSHIFREVNRPLPANRVENKYIVFDGDVDAVWVENMNSVMDDNKLLTLPNGERIRLQSHCKLLFEVAELQYASPATISRCGMVYVDSRNLGYQPYIDSWLADRPHESHRSLLVGLMNKYIKPCLDWVMEGFNGHNYERRPTQIVPRTALNLTKQFCVLFECSSIFDNEENFQDHQAIEAVFIWCLIWSIGACLIEKPAAKDRTSFDLFVKKISGLGLVDEVKIPVSRLPVGSLYDYSLDTVEWQWVTWDQKLPQYQPPLTGSFSDILVPTVDTIRSTRLVDLVVSGGHPCLLVGDSGTAKTTIVEKYLEALSVDHNVILGLSFSSRTKAKYIQRALEDVIEKRTKDSYGPPVGKRLHVFVDDLNMPQVDLYGTQQPIAFLKMFVERSGFYDLNKELNWKKIKDTQVIGAMGPPGGARSAVDPRFMSNFNVFNIQFPSRESLNRIYTSMLGNHLESFPSSMNKLTEQIVYSTIEVYEAIMEVLPPTPSRFHYIFNLRDLSRIFEGLLSSHPLGVKTNDGFIRLWRNECLRVFHDRLICNEDRDLVDSKLKDIINKNFPDHHSIASVEPLLFGTLKTPSNKEETCFYQDLKDFESVKEWFGDVLQAYSQNLKPMNIVLFNYALDHLLRICRTLRLPRGHCLLVGVGGSGKKSLTRLAAFTCGYEVFEITLTRGYGEFEFKEDLKQLFQFLGIENKKVAFLFTDDHVAQECFLEMINSLLTSGMIPGLFDASEKETLIQSVQTDVESSGVASTKDTCWKFFINRCRDNLHIVMTTSPVGDTLRTRCRNFPALVNETVIDWFTPWPTEALQSVALSFLEGSEYNYVTPKNYLDFIATYKKTLLQEQRKFKEQKKRLGGGLEKLIQAAEEVAVMQTDLKEATVVVENATIECNELLQTISTNTIEVEGKQKIAQEKEEYLKTESERIAVEKKEAEAALEEAIPALEEAAAALKDLKKDDITEIRSFAKPHILVQKVCEAVVILRGLKDVSWSGAKTMMADSQFLKTLLEFDKDGLTEKQVKKVKEYMKDPKFNVSLLKWVLAMVNYNNVAKTVEPKRKKVADSERNLRTAQKDLTRTKEEVKKLNTQLSELNFQFQEKTVEQKELQMKADLMARRLEAASKLVTGLSSEQERWTEDMAQIEDSVGRLIGDCLITASFLSYSGAFTFEYRQSLIHEDWVKDLINRGIAMSQPFLLEKLMTTEVQISKWVSQGLPSDELSIQNGILATRSNRWPLCIDPQMQANNWIKNREGKNLEGKMKSFHDGDFLKQLELSIQYGLPFLFENLEEYIDPVIDNVLEQNFIPGNRKMVLLGDKEVEWDDNFRLYMTTKLSNPHYGPDVSGKVMIINYSVTLQGLTDQLLNATVSHEREDLEKQRKLLIAEMAENKSTLSRLEDILLRELSNAQGNILDNTELISTLEDTKTKANEISEKLQIASRTAKEIEVACKEYTPVAKRGAILFFLLNSLSNVCNMYEYSLQSFLGVFNKSLMKAPAGKDIKERIHSIVEVLTLDVFNFTSIGLFEKHKLLFTFQMALKIAEGEGLLNKRQLEFFLKGNLALEKDNKPKPHDWIPEQGWQDIKKLVEISTIDDPSSPLTSLITNITNNEKEWKEIYDHEAPERMKFPCEETRSLTIFERLLVLRCLRLDRVTKVIREYIATTLGAQYNQPPVVKYWNLYEQSTQHTPLLFVLSPGADPVFDVMNLGEQLGFKPGQKLKQISLGQGMGKKAEELVLIASTRGTWVMLQNCHLLPKWLKHLEKLLEKLNNPHIDFRLWLTTDPTDYFPLGILQKSIKVVTEPPNGLKQNMSATYSKIDDAKLNECPHPAFKPLVYILAFLHAVLQERRKYGKLGWNVPYDFNETDFRISSTLISTYLTKASSEAHKDALEMELIPWSTLKYLIGEAMYGGRVSDHFDRRVLTTYLDEYLGDFIFDEFSQFSLCHEDSNGYQMPQETAGDVTYYRHAIQCLPMSQSPYVFGLHENANISYQTNITKCLWIDIIQLQPRTQGAASSGGQRENQVTKMIEDILKKIPSLFDVEMIKKGMKEWSPVQVVLLQELDHFNRLVSHMNASLMELSRALIGEVGFSNELESLAESLYNGLLPSSWTKLSPETEKTLGSWLEWFQCRYQQYVNWVENGEPVVMWLSGLHVPETYLAALIQRACRLKGWPLDRATLTTEVTQIEDFETIQDRLELGCYIKGVYLEGAKWDIKTEKLMRQIPKQLVMEMPIMKLIPKDSSDLKKHNSFLAPVYMTQRRRNAMGEGYVFHAELTSDEHPSHWTLQGVALMLNIQ
eukprot:g5050.t1